MFRRSPLARLERAVLDEERPLSFALRQVVLLGGRTGSAELRAWALRELNSYDGEDEIPEYRKVPGTLTVDREVGHGFLTGQQISPLLLPDFAQGKITEWVRLNNPVRQLEMLARQDGQLIKIDIPMSADLAMYMNHEHNLAIYRLYWSVHRSALQGTVDQIRTRLVEFVAELQAVMPSRRSDPTPEQVARVVQHINITVGDHSPVQVAAPIAHADRRSRAVIGVPEVAVITIAAVAGAVLTWWLIRQ